MNPALIAALIQQVGIPEFVRWLQHRHDDTGALPTDADVLAQLQTDADEGIKIGEEWLAAHFPQA